MTLVMERIQAICFDVDGTLSDTDDQWVQDFSQRMALLRYFSTNKDVRPLARWLVMVLESPGNLAYESLDRLHLDDDLARFMSWFSQRQVGRKPQKFWLIPGVQELLIHLQGRYPMAVVSARDAFTTQLFLKQFDLDLFFKAIATSQTCIYTKPFPHPVQWAAEQMKVSPQACLMVGDTTVDIRAGKAAGAQTVGVLCGFGTERELRRAGADLIVKSTAELKDVLGAVPNAL